MNRLTTVATDTSGLLPPVTLHNVRVVGVLSVATPLLAAIVHHTHYDEDNQTMYHAYGTRGQTRLDLKDALKDWMSGADTLGENSTAGIIQEPGDLETFLRASGVDSERSKLRFDRTHEQHFAQAGKTLTMAACCVVEYELRAQESYVVAQNARCDSAVQQTLLTDATCVRRVQQRAKRARTEIRTARAIVTGHWPCVSSAIPFDIVARPSRKNNTGANTPQYDSTTAGCSIVPHVRQRVPLRDVATAMQQGSQFRPAHVNAVMRSLFPRVFRAPVHERHAADPTGDTLQSPVGSAEELDLQDPLDNTVDIKELQKAIELSNQVSMIVLMSDRRAVFSTILLLLYAKHIKGLAQVYGPTGWQPIVARGEQFMRDVFELLTKEPHTLAIDALKYMRCVELQDEYNELVQKSRIAKDNAKMRHWMRTMFAMRHLAAMPELRWAVFQKLLGPTHEISKMSAGVDIYQCILRADITSMTDYSTDDHRSRVRSSMRGSSNSHMFTVLGDNCYEVDESFDPAHSDGTFCLAEYDAAKERERAARSMQIDRADTTSSVAVHTRTPIDESVNGEEAAEDAINGSQRLEIRAYGESSAAASSSAQTAVSNSLPPIQHLHDARARCHTMYTTDQFVDGLRWLLVNQVCFSETHVGTGPCNFGKHFDAFYLGDMWRSQERIVKTVGDIYERGLNARLTRNVTLSDAQRKERADLLDRTLAVRASVRRQLSSLLIRRRWRKSCASSGTETPDDVAIRTAGEKADLAVMSALLKVVRKECTEQESAMKDLAPLDDEKYYALKNSPIHPSNHRLVQRHNPLDADVHAFEHDDADSDDDDSDDDDQSSDNSNRVRRKNAVELSDEQREAIRFALNNPITILMAPGGCGKTETMRELVKAFSPDQVIITAQTAKACQVLTERVGAQARTLASLQVNETKYLQARERHERRKKALKYTSRSVTADDARDQNFQRMWVEIEDRVGIADATSHFEFAPMAIIDEMSLADTELFRRFMSFAHPMREGGPFIERLVLLGDIDQLASIGPGSVLADMCRAFPHCVRFMTKNFRSDGRSIFSMSRRIAMRHSDAAEHDFDAELNAHRLATPTSYRVSLTDSVSDAREKERLAEDASLVFIEATNDTYEARLTETLIALGAHSDAYDMSDEDRERMYTLREQTHIIAPTNAIVEKCNRVCRELYHGVHDPFVNQRTMPPEVARHVVRNDKIFFRRNMTEYVRVPRESIARARSDYTSEVNEDDLRDACSSAAERSTVGQQAIERIENFVEQKCGEVLGQGAADTARFEVRASNSEILTVVGFFNTYTKRSAAHKCVCHRCPKPVETHQLCALLPHVVPRVFRTVDHSPLSDLGIPYHDAGMQYVNGEATSAEFCRMIVLRLKNHSFRMFSVSSFMANSAAYSLAFASTVHRAQGDGWPFTILVLPYDSKFANRLMAYTAATRASKRFIVIGQPRAWRRVCERAPPLRRSELWLLTAQRVAEIHKKFDSDNAPLADRLGFAYDEERAFFEHSETASLSERWAYFDRMRAAALARAQLTEL